MITGPMAAAGTNLPACQALAQALQWPCTVHSGSGPAQCTLQLRVPTACLV
jgi:hypothetical protein